MAKKKNSSDNSSNDTLNSTIEKSTINSAVSSSSEFGAFSDNIDDIDLKVLKILLKDRTTGVNIIWGTTNYAENHGDKYSHNMQIKIEQITGSNSNIIIPRIQKSKIEQKSRVKNKAEVFTPSWICNFQNNLLDEARLNKVNAFNIANDKEWTVVEEPISFENSKEDWKEYVEGKSLEITCGEAPYIVSRYDTVSGEYIPLKRRIGFLDRKVRVVNENVNSDEEWLFWVKRAFQASYGFEWQGDNLLIARKNLLYSFYDYYLQRFNELPPISLQQEIADIISWNIWQMDGLKCVVPNSCKPVVKIERNLFGQEEEKEAPCPGCAKNNRKNHTGIYSKVKDWDDGSLYTFLELFDIAANSRLVNDLKTDTDS
jgi:hypothetical protein